MKKKTLSHLFLYRWRYLWGYSALILIFSAVISVALLYAPGGISQSEINMVARTNLLMEGNWSIVNLPLHAFQAALFLLFGVSTLTIKLPAVTLMCLAALALFFLLRHWFKPGIAVLSLSLMIATGQFIYLAQSFTPGIIYITTASLILLFASLIIQKAKFAQLWKILLAAVMAASLYTPFFWYLNLGLILVALLHPYTRYIIVSRKYRASWTPAFIVFLLVSAPLVYFCLKNHGFLLDVSGWSSLNFDILANLKIIVRTYLWPVPYISNGQVLPAIDVSTVALMFLGMIITFRNWHTARSYVVNIWLFLSLPLLALAPQVNMIISVPMFILLATGVERLLYEWYRLFPKNPYARGTGLVLMIILVGVMTLSGVNRYVHSYHDLPDAVREHSKDLSLVRDTLLRDAANKRYIFVVAAAEKPLYDALSSHMNKHNVAISISDGLPAEGTPEEVVVTRAARQNITGIPGTITRVITNDWAEAGDRFYVYKLSE